MKVRGENALIAQTVRIMVVGLCAALEAGRIRIEDAEFLLFSPRTMSLLEDRGMGQDLIDLIHHGTELEDMESLLPDQLAASISELREAALAGLGPAPPGEVDLRSWFVNNLAREVER